jgi:octaprenyl-diphosphate synthase
MSVLSSAPPSGSGSAPNDLSLDDVYAPIAGDLQRVHVVFREELSSDQAFIADLCTHVASYHGKLLRPALVLLCGKACGEVGPSHHVVAAVAEMVHIATLVHDDVLDEADTRRRVATINRLSGNERAVLLGDFLISHAFHLCSSLGSQHASRRIGATTNEVCEGELMQVANRGQFELSESLYFEIIKRKTASLIGTCCELGGWCSGASAEVQAKLAQFGISMGIAFQIVDDVLDLTGEESVVGKSLGRDLEKGKLTLPLIRLRDRSDADGRARLQQALALNEPARTREVTRMLKAAGALDDALGIARRYVDEAVAALDALPASDIRERLRAMAGFVLARQR